jgi:replicative DNA helicase
MKLSAPIFQLKRRAKLKARTSNIPLHAALDQIAREEGYARWSMLSARVAASSLSAPLLSRLGDGELLLIAGRPGHGKTVLGLRLLLDAVRDGRRAILFTLEFTEQQARHHLRSLEGEPNGISGRVEVVTSDQISADYIVDYMSGCARGTVAVIDYLQILDQQRSKPVLAEQISTFGNFAAEAGIVFGFISQIDRSFDPQTKPLPDIGDIRLPNSVDLGVFAKACFLHDGETQVRDLS